MGEFFSKLWEIEMSKFSFLLDYWYVGVIALVLTVILGFATNK